MKALLLIFLVLSLPTFATCGYTKGIFSSSYSFKDSLKNRVWRSVSSYNSDHKVFLLAGRLEAEIARENLIKSEKVELLLSTYIFQIDEFGRKEIGLLADAVKRGVKVSILVDAVGKNRGSPSFANSNKILAALKELGIQVKIYNPKVRRFHKLNSRSHTKSIIGSDSMIIGDRNYSSEYFRRGKKKNYVSTELLIKGDEVQNAKTAFKNVFYSTSALSPVTTHIGKEYIEAALKNINSWANSVKKKQRSLRVNAKSVANLQYVDDSLKNVSVGAEIIALLKRANYSIDIVNPYIVLTPDVENSLKDAIRRGVKVRILTNNTKSTDVRLVAEAWRQDAKKLHKLGVDIHEMKNNNFLHSKILLIDKKTTYVGSFNLDPRSQNINLENGVIIEDQKFGSNMSKYIARLSKALAVKTEKFPSHFGSSCLQLISKLLRSQL